MVSSVPILFEPGVSGQLRVAMIFIRIVHVENGQMIPVKQSSVLDSKSPEVFLHLLGEKIRRSLPGDYRNPGKVLVRTSFSPRCQSSAVAFSKSARESRLGAFIPSTTKDRGFYHIDRMLIDSVILLR